MSLAAAPGIEVLELDFGLLYSGNDLIQPYCSDSLPPELLATAAALGISIRLSRYPVIDEIDS